MIDAKGFNASQRKATAALITAILEIAEEVSSDEGSIGVGLNAVVSAYVNLAVNNGLQADGAKALRMAAELLEHHDEFGLLNTRAAGRA